MRGRLTVDRVNAALDEIAGKAENTAALISSFRSAPSSSSYSLAVPTASSSSTSIGSTKLSVAERKMAAELFHNVQSRDELRGHVHWVLESDLWDTVSARPDCTGRTLLTLLRHLGRLQEVRCTVGGTATSVHVMLYPSKMAESA
mmetsp:Transcript_21240/g.37978  ORF Transcript_21240/g.37978 Transcript_21240/m.37978 type:complete len:145 (+) Transcript_21240:892-1326(+)